MKFKILTVFIGLVALMHAESARAEKLNYGVMNVEHVNDDRSTAGKSNRLVLVNSLARIDLSCAEWQFTINSAAQPLADQFNVSVADFYCNVIRGFTENLTSDTKVNVEIDVDIETNVLEERRFQIHNIYIYVPGEVEPRKLDEASAIQFKEVVYLESLVLGDTSASNLISALKSQMRSRYRDDGQELSTNVDCLRFHSGLGYDLHIECTLLDLKSNVETKLLDIFDGSGDHVIRDEGALNIYNALKDIQSTTLPGENPPTLQKRSHILCHDFPDSDESFKKCILSF